jgi:hypothetical protein
VVIVLALVQELVRYPGVSDLQYTEAIDARMVRQTLPLAGRAVCRPQRLMPHVRQALLLEHQSCAQARLLCHPPSSVVFVWVA